jgi:hypothetical protein
MDSGLLYDSASVAAKTRHFEELFAIWVFALWTHNCAVSSPQGGLPQNERFFKARSYCGDGGAVIRPNTLSDTGELQ